MKGANVMLFNVTLFNTGSFEEAAVAVELGMSLTKNGNFRGWISKEAMEQFDRKGFFYRVW